LHAIKKFQDIASEERFKGWPLVAESGQMTAKIPYFGQIYEYDLVTPNGTEHYASIIRHFGWAVVFGVTTENNVLTLVQWKPGVNRASWELPPGGIGKIPPDISEKDLLDKTRKAYLKETGYGMGSWTKLGIVTIKTGKYRGAGPDDHGLNAHLYLAHGLEKQQDARNPEPNEIMETLEVPLTQFRDVLKSGLFVEASAVPCALMALHKMGW
jgi:hypothetical protein